MKFKVFHQDNSESKHDNRELAIAEAKKRLEPFVPEGGSVKEYHEDTGHASFWALDSDKKVVKEDFYTFMNPISNEEDISDQIGEVLERFKERYPKLGLSFGYIGNIYPNLDDRSFRIFTKWRWANPDAGTEVYYPMGGASSKELGSLLELVKGEHFPQWCARITEKIDAGKGVYRRG